MAARPEERAEDPSGGEALCRNDASSERSGGSTEAPSASSSSRQVTFESVDENFRAFVPCGGQNGNDYGSCFWVPPPPTNVCRIYHNRKKTSYTEHVVEASARPACKTLIQLLESETDPARCRVMKAAYLEGDASEDSNLMDVLHGADANGWQPLLIATQRRQASAVGALLELGASVDCRDPRSGWTPLMYAVANGDEPTVRVLLEHGASVNSFAKPSDWNALCVAILSNQSRFVELLFEAGADLQLIKKRHPDLAEMYTTAASKCLSCECSKKECQTCRLPGCTGQGQDGAGCGARQRLMSSLGPLLIAAIQRGQVAEVEKLLEQGADVDFHDRGSGWTPLMYAVAIGDLAIVKRLLRRGASPDTVARPCCWNALSVALLESRWEVVDLLLDHGADINVVRQCDPDMMRSCNAEVSAHLRAREERKAQGITVSTP